MLTPTEQLLRELIALPSVNPAFLPDPASAPGERPVAEFLAATAARAGLDVEFQPVFPGRSNLLVRLSPPGAVRHRVLLAPHLDTVNATPDQFLPRRHQGRLYGRGACDTKGSVAAMTTALCDLARSGQRPQTTELVLAGLVDEENGQSGSRALVRSGFAADLAIVGEPTCLKVVTAHKGDLWLSLRTAGRSAHSSRPELGRNAVLEMARVVEWVETKYAAVLKRRRHALLGCATVNVGTIVGGTQPNIVPDECAIRVDRRTLPGETEAQVVRELRAGLRAAGVKAAVSSEKQAPCLALETDLNQPLVAAFLRSLGQRRPVGVDYFCDASILSHGGTPSVLFGPGDIAQAHTAQEWVSLASLESARDRLCRFFQSLP